MKLIRKLLQYYRSQAYHETKKLSLEMHGRAQFIYGIHLPFFF